jgi:signal transduction histidine kinase/signal recognition particle receptor subunit beta
LVEINHREHFIRAKVLYYGPAAGGKTTNLQALHRRALKDKRLHLVSVNTAQDRTILFDLLPLSVPAFRSYELRFQVVAVPGQRLYAATRKMLLKNADSIVFVANSASDRWQENIQSMKEMTEYLLGHGMDPSTLPVIFQYNKRDLPNTVNIEIMERGLNARRSESFPAIAIREEGILETFAAALRRTMTELSTRYNIGENLTDPRSARDWTERTMLETFGVTGMAKPFDLRALEPKPKAVPEIPATPPPTPAPEIPAAPTPAPAPEMPVAPTTIVRVKTPSQPRISLTAPAAPPREERAPSIKSGREKTVPSAAVEFQDPQAAQSLLESYAEAASGLGDHITFIREEKDQAMRWLEDLSAVADLVQDLLTKTDPSSDAPLQTLVQRMARNFRTPTASLSILRPDDVLETVVLCGFDTDPLQSSRSPGGQPLGPALLRSGRLTVQIKGEPGPLDDVIDRAGRECIAAVALPLRTASGPLGLLMFYLPQEAAVPSPSSTKYLERASVQLTAALDAAANRVAVDRLERILRGAFTGRAARHAIHWAEEPLAQIESVTARLRARPDNPGWLSESLLQIENNLLKLKAMRQSITGLAAGLLPPKTPTPLEELLREVENEFRGPLKENGIELQIEAKPALPPLRAEPFLLWSILYHFIEDARRSLAGTSTGGIIRVLATEDEDTVHLTIFDNASALAPKSSPSRYLAWPFERRLGAIETSFIEPAMEFLKAQFSVEIREGVGTVRNLIFPIA